MTELANLAAANNMTVVGQIVQKLESPMPQPILVRVKWSN